MQQRAKKREKHIYNNIMQGIVKIEDKKQNKDYTKMGTKRDTKVDHPSIKFTSLMNKRDIKP